MTSPKRRSIGLDVAESEVMQRRYGVGPAQVRRDHLISHVLGALSRLPERDDLTFFGGTALSRTLLPDLRLSEDIDLLVTGNRVQMCMAITERLESALSRTHGVVEWFPPLAQTNGAQPAVLRVEGVVQVQVQVISDVGYPSWPTELTSLHQRYSDAPPAELKVLTPPAFVAAKMSAWHDRRASRDLYDLWALSRAGLVDAAALDLYVKHGPTGRAPARHDFTRCPSRQEWRTSLSHQGRIRVEPGDAAREVGRAWRNLG